MSIGFASKISALRREKNITQKSAAEQLGISQALLSHYEKGIRECNLEFVKKAAVFYDVSADYLLGLSDTKHGNRDIFDESDIPSDTQPGNTTILRAFISLMNTAEEEGGDVQKYFNSFFAIAVKKFIARMTAEKKNYPELCDLASDSLQIIKTELKNKPQCVKTTEAYAADLINAAINKLISDN